MRSTTVQRRPVTQADLDPLARLHHGDRDAFTELYRLTEARLTRYAAVRLRDHDRDAVDDVVQDAFCLALNDPQLLGADLLGSMLKLTACAVTRYGWSQRRYVRAAYTLHESRTATDIPPVLAVTVTHGPAFRQILSRLTDSQRQAIQLRYFDGCSRDRTADEMGRTIHAVRWLERTALRRLHTECAATAL